MFSDIYRTSISSLKEASNKPILLNFLSLYASDLDPKEKPSYFLKYKKYFVRVWLINVLYF